jgi:hypothetical protein
MDHQTERIDDGFDDNSDNEQYDRSQDLRFFSIS